MKKLNLIILLLMAVSYSLVFVPVVNAASVPILYEYYNTGSDNGSNNITITQYTTQIITTSSNHTITSIKVPLKRVGTDFGYAYLSIRKSTTSTGNATGNDLAYSTLVYSAISTVDYAWYTFNLNTELNLDSSNYYAIILHTTTGDNAANNLLWQSDNGGGYAGGVGLYSTDSGATWISESPKDYLFEVWGNTTLSIQDVKVFSSYQVSGDWLIAIRYLNLYPPYYDTYDVRQYFDFQLLDTANVTRASSSVRAWGNKPGCIYLSPAIAGSLEWGKPYKIRIYGKFTGNPYTEYTLVSADWIGSDLVNLDSWVISSCNVIKVYYPTLTLTNTIAQRGELLSPTGGPMFELGIPGLSLVRPTIFQTYTTTGTSPVLSVDTTYMTSLKNWAAFWGPDGAAMLTGLGNMIGVGGGVIGAMFFLIPMLALMIWGFMPSSSHAASVLSLPILLASVLAGTDLLYIVIIAAIAVFLFIKQWWFDK